jgi:hypothetical protein
MKKSHKIVGAIASGLLGISVLAGCSSAADVAADNISKAAEQFEVYRHIVGINGITDKYLFEITGYCSVETSNSALGNSLEVTCKTGPSSYNKTFLGLSDNSTFTVQQVDDIAVSEDQFRVIIRPDQLLPQFEVDSQLTN